jgi:hypothetical protein
MAKFKENYYFDIENGGKITKLQQIIDLTKSITFISPGKPHIFKVGETLQNPTYSNYGLFRGQNLDWPIVPSSYRNFIKSPNFQRWHHGGVYDKIDFYNYNRSFMDFSKLCKNQIVSFPRDIIEQLVIAQHYGIPTPLLDWTESVWVALFFGIRLYDIKKTYPGFRDFYIYHVKDSNLIGDERNQIFDVYSTTKLHLIRPFPIDNRIERQRSIFSFHPHPNIFENKIPVTKYRISGHLVHDILLMFNSIGISTERLFPDYAGIASRIMSKNLIKI